MSTQQLANNGIGLNETDYASFPVFIPDSLKFKAPRQALAARRIPVKHRTEQQTYSSNNNKLIRILLPNNAIYDMRSGYITFSLSIGVTGGTYARLHNGIFSAFNRLRILVASTEVEDLRDYNRIYAALWEMKNPTSVTSAIGNTIMGFGTQVERNALGAGSEYAMPLLSGILDNELLPFDNIKQGMVVELYIEDPTTCVETDGTNPIITISNLNFHYERLELDKNYREFIKSYVSTHGLQLGYHTWERYVNTLTTGTRQDIMINHRSSSMNGMLNFLIDSNDLNNTAVNDKYTTWLPLSLQSTSVLINGTTFPDEPIDTVFGGRFEPYQMYCRWNQKYKLSGILPIAPSIAWKSFGDDKFVQIDDFEPYPEVDGVVNPFTTLQNNSTIIKKLTFSLPVPNGYQLDSWVEYYRQIKICMDGQVRVIQ